MRRLGCLALLFVGCADPGPPREIPGDATVRAVKCLDLDSDGFGEGPDCRGPDCDDHAPGVNPRADEVCDEIDNDCDGNIDEGGCACELGATLVCGAASGLCSPGTQVCVDGEWGPCQGAVAAREELCNGEDDDCDGEIDEIDPAGVPDCPLRQGVCASAKATCLGADGWGECGRREYGSDWVADEGPDNCDELDNNCDGVVDEGCNCLEGERRACGSGEGACSQGTQVCEIGRWGACQGAVQPVMETCDGLDDDCDGEVDEDLTPRPCERVAGVCAGAQAVCDGAGGWRACDADRYRDHHAAYVVEETAADCDELDNDCDGRVDEACVVVINEVLFDAEGGDAPRAFIELFGPPGLSLDGLSLQGVNGANGDVYRRITLDGARVPADGFFVISTADAEDALHAATDLVSSGADLQNGPDSVRLVRVEGEEVQDALGYLAGPPGSPGEFDDPAFNAGEGAPAPAITPGQSLSRDAAHADTDDNGRDFRVLDEPTPGR